MRLGKVVRYVKEGDTILDFGCGSRSFLLEKVSNRITAGVGLDYDVKDRLEGKIRYLNFRFKKTLPFKDKSHDKVFLLAVLEHIKPEMVNALFLEFKRILKKGGMIILTTPTPRSKFFLEFLAFRLGVISKKEIMDHKKYYGSKDIDALLLESGLKLIDYKLFQFGLNSRVIIGNE